ncbi:unnamed protein product, partial [Symbiodinium pilosum]
LKLESFTKFVDFILGDKVANLRLPSSSGKEQFPPRPPWTIVLAFEYKLRAEAMRMVVEDGETIAGALEKVVKDPSLKETYFTTPLALHAAEQPSKYRKGPTRHCDIRSCLEKLVPNIVVREFDICRDDKHDLAQANVWEEIYAVLAKPNTVFITSPPCNTHSRARHRKPGPQPLRSSVWPRGFPWLTPPKAAAVEAQTI